VDRRALAFFYTGLERGTAAAVRPPVEAAAEPP
jgi:hypothetical protein